MSGPLAYGDRVLLVDAKKHHYLLELKEGGEFHTHKGIVRHDDLVGRPEGIVAMSTRNVAYTILRPTLEDVVLLMPRGAQVIYPKDIGPILVRADIAPGVRVFESGVGSAALSMGLLRAGAHVVGYELREDFANRARTNVGDFLGPDHLERYDVHLRDSYEGIDPAHGPFDRAVLDLPEPWQVLPHLEQVLVPGASFVAYTPSIVQAAQTRERLDRGPWAECKTMEVLHRTWHVEGLAVRPDHRMVAHTGFLTSARFLGSPTSVEG